MDIGFLLHVLYAATEYHKARDCSRPLTQFVASGTGLFNRHGKSTLTRNLLIFTEIYD